MILTISLIIATLVVINFLLLIFSCNRTAKKEIPEIISEKKRPNFITSQLNSIELAPAGS